MSQPLKIAAALFSWRVLQVDNGALRMTKQHNSSDGLLDKIQTAELLNISLRTLDTKLKAGTIPHIRLGKLVRFDPSDIKAYILAHKIGG